MRARGLDKAAADDEDVLFDYDPETDGSAEPYDEYDDAAEENNISNPLDHAYAEPDRLQLDLYTSHQRILSSDHKPLTAMFTIEYEGVDAELKAKVHQEVVRELDRAENEGRPNVTIVVDRHSEELTRDGSALSGNNDASSGVRFGDVAFKKIILRGLTIANTGRVLATFSFAKRQLPGDGEEVAPSWLQVTMSDQSEIGREIQLEPGDATNVVLRLQVTNLDQVKHLNQGSTTIDDILVLKVENGRDHFIPVRGNWLQSCFGRSVDELVRIPEGGVRSLQSRANYQEKTPDQQETTVKWSAPRELFRLTEAIELQFDRVMAERSMLAANQPENHVPDFKPGWPISKDSWTAEIDNARESQKSKVLEKLDNGQDLKDCFYQDVTPVERLEVLCDVLVEFLDSLTDGVITELLWVELEKLLIAQEKSRQTSNPEEERAAILEVLTSAPHHNISFVFLTATLGRMASELAPLETPNARKSIDSVRSSRSRALSLSQDPAVAKRLLIGAAYAELFAHVIVKAPLPPRDRERRAAMSRRRGMLELFIRKGSD